MSRVLILFAHPALQKSRINKILIQNIRDIENVTFHDLYQAYPEFAIDVNYEQKLLLDHDIIIFHHPFFWYSTPAILKEWQDLVLEHGWAYGSKGTALQGKKFLNVITTGGREEAYSKDGYNRNTIRDLLLPIEQTARLCGMQYYPPFVVHGTHRITMEDVKKYADEYRELLIAMTKDKVDWQASQRLTRINKDLSKIMLEKNG